ncbi:hypothetical protein CTAYLR_006208 [Chrysophaeum taylorii]|uniref:RRM domain-containing protein n=1 Tax=Chrysophaeum taylorii TaxID=2483200 RepID=A0AAD7XI45_9STRA|nr:hypothetical protein CTAYLR_006208 [Chrysophaeum taylorii]
MLVALMVLGSVRGDEYYYGPMCEEEAVLREFVVEKEECAAAEVVVEDDAFGAFRAAAVSAAGVEKATALAIVLLVIEHGAAPFDDPEVVALCRSLDRPSRESLLASLEDYFGDFYESASLELGALRYALEDEPEEEEEDELWIDIFFFLIVFGVACALSAAVRRLSRLSKPKKKKRQKLKKKKTPKLLLIVEEEESSDDELEEVVREPSPEPDPKPNKRKQPKKETKPSPKPPAPPKPRRRPSPVVRLPQRPQEASKQPVVGSLVDCRSFAEALAPTKKHQQVVASVKVVPLPPRVRDRDLENRFARYGGVVGARVFGDADPPHGYVDFSCRADAVAAAFDAHGRALFSTTTTTTASGDDGRVACIVRERALSDSDLNQRRPLAFHLSTPTSSSPLINGS